jgi:hypothetical protein
MSFLDKAKELAEQAKEKAGGAIDKAGDAVEKAGDLAAKGVDAAASGVDKATGGKYTEKIGAVSGKLEGVLDPDDSTGLRSASGEATPEEKPKTEDSGKSEE